MGNDAFFGLLGRLKVDLFNLEFSARAFMDWNDRTAAASETEQRAVNLNTLAKGDEVPINHFTDYRTLEAKLGQANEVLAEHGLRQLDVDAMKAIRDAIAHGRLVSPGPRGPWRLVKFSKENKVRQTVVAEFVDEVDLDWLRSSRDRVVFETRLLFEAAHHLGFTGIPGPDDI